MTVLDRYREHRRRSRAIRAYLEAHEPLSRLDRMDEAEWLAATNRLQRMVNGAIGDGQLPEQRTTNE